VTITIAAATLLFWFVLHQISAVWLDVALRPEVRAALERSREDQKALRSHDPSRRAEYRKRFDETQKLINRIEVLRMNRQAMLRRFELALILSFALSAAAAAVLLWIRYRRAQERERREYLERVTSLQETARRHAHEIKGPLTAARLSSFAGIGTPVLRRESLGQMLEEFCTTFANAWPGLALQDSGGDAVVCVDRDMFRQVLMNLCSNSARAGAAAMRFMIVRNGLQVMLEARDDGSGIGESLRARVFDPYVTTRRIGEGMGLGLSISRKVMLEHGGDLVLASTSTSGTTFRVIFGVDACN
jgi:two-component system C4-dicarboxylate transport sensor histidine kinase DctB